LIEFYDLLGRIFGVLRFLVDWSFYDERGFLVGFSEAWRRLLMARFYDEEGRVWFGPNTPFVFGYDGINRAPFRVSLIGVLPSSARFCFTEIL
jgi:hypothetical protein